jgi:hypothetical protein
MQYMISFYGVGKSREDLDFVCGSSIVCTSSIVFTISILFAFKRQLDERRKWRIIEPLAFFDC